MNGIKTKIICTLGPSTADDGILREIMLSGMNVARLNFSHGTHQTHGETMDRVKRMRQELKLPIALMLDTKGPEIRIGTFAEKKVTLHPGDAFRLCTVPVDGTAERVSISYPALRDDLHPGDTVLIDDGLVSLRVTAIEQDAILCRVENEGTISDRKSVNVPGVSLSIPFLSEQDKDDIRFGLTQQIDFIAA